MYNFINNIFQTESMPFSKDLLIADPDAYKNKENFTSCVVLVLNTAYCNTPLDTIKGFHPRGGECHSSKSD